MLLVFENAPLQVSRWLLHTVMQLPSHVCCHYGHDTFLLADDSFKEGDLQEKRKQRYWSGFLSVFTVLDDDIPNGSGDTFDAEGGCVKHLGQLGIIREAISATFA
jgi:hypothetical protein